MRKIAIITIIVLFFDLSAQAQLFTIGPKVGLTSTNVNIRETAGAALAGTSELGYHAGLFSRITIAGFYIQPEAYFHGISGSYVDTSTGIDQDVEFNRNQIDVPILFGYKLAGFLRVNAGPVANFQVGDIRFNREDLSNTSASQALDNYRNNAFGFQAGVGLDISKITLDVRYQADFNSITQSQGEDYRFNHLLFTVGFKIL